MISSELKTLLKSKKGKCNFDVVVFCSGGKDSSYALSVVAENISNPAKILAVTMDNGFLSETAKRNIEFIVHTLGACRTLIYIPIQAFMPQI